MGVAGNFRARHPLLSALILPMCGATLLVVVYFLLPLGRSFGGRTVVFLVVGLVAFGALVALQLAQISGSPYPRLRAITALATSVASARVGSGDWIIDSSI